MHGIRELGGLSHAQVKGPKAEVRGARDSGGDFSARKATTLTLTLSLSKGEGTNRPFVWSSRGIAPPATPLPSPGRGTRWAPSYGVRAASPPTLRQGGGTSLVLL